MARNRTDYQAVRHALAVGFLAVLMAESDLEQKVAHWTGERTPEYGALCNDLAQMKLNKVLVSQSPKSSLRKSG